MGRFSKNKLAGSTEISDAVDDAIDGAGLVTTTDLNTAIGNVEDFIAEVSDDVLSTIGRKLLRAPTNVTGSGGVGTEVDQYTVLTLPAGFTPADGWKYRINGTTLVRNGSSQRVAEIAVRDLIVMYSEAIPSWSDTPGKYTTGQVVLHIVDKGGGIMEQHMFSALQNATSGDEPPFGGDAVWSDLGGSSQTPDVAAWDEVKAADVTITTHGATTTTEFDAEADLPEVAFNASTGKLALVSKPKDGRTVEVEFDGSIANIGKN